MPDMENEVVAPRAKVAEMEAPLLAARDAEIAELKGDEVKVYDDVLNSRRP